MSRVVQFLAGATVAAAATANLACSGADGANCSSCVGTGITQVCATVQVPPQPICVGCLGTACTAATAPAQACFVCVPTLTIGGLATSLGICAPTTANVAAYVTANSTVNAALSAGGNLDLKGFANTVALVTANVTAGAAGASGTVVVDAGNYIVNLATTATAGATVNVQVNGDANSNNIFQVNQSLNVGAWNNAGTAQVNNNNNVVLSVNHLNLGAGVSGSASGSRSDFLVTQQTGASTTFGSIDFGSSSSVGSGQSNSASSSVLVAGGTAHFGGSAVAGGNAAGTGAVANITNNGYIQLSNGVSVDGSLPSSATVTVDSTGSNAALASIEAGTSFNVAGDVLASVNGAQNTASTNAVIAVNGALTVSGSMAQRVQPRVVLNSGASFVINATATASTKFRADAVSVATGATLVIGSAANRANVLIQQIAQCTGTVRINLAVTADVYIAAQAAASSAGTASAGATSNVGFTYNSNNNVDELVKCNVQVVDSAGVTYNLASRTAASAGRRLLASNGEATWGSDQMTFTMQKQSNSAAVSFAVIPILMVSMAGLLF